MKKISIVSPTYNEEGNVPVFYKRLKDVMARHPLNYEIIFIDNASTDNTVSILRNLAKQDDKVKVILNATNFGQIRSHYYGLLQADGDAALLLASDLQDPPENIDLLLKEWFNGSKVVLAVKASSDEGWPFRVLRNMYYGLLSKMSTVPLVKNATGAGLFDKEVIAELRKLIEPYPYFRGLVTELGFPVSKVEFHQPARLSGKTKNNWLTLYDIGMLGLTTHGGAAIRVVTLVAFAVATLSIFVSIGYFVAKLVNWNSFELGLAPLILGVFFFGSFQVFMLGLLGEYIANIQRRLRNLPLVIESERINF
jgi:glycosyltransferase involved in cell wall biosynthesis